MASARGKAAPSGGGNDISGHYLTDRAELQTFPNNVIAVVLTKGFLCYFSFQTIDTMVSIIIFYALEFQRFILNV